MKRYIDLIFTIAVLFTVILVSHSLYKDFKGESDSGGDVVGKVDFVYKNSQRRPSNRLIWQKLSSDREVYNNDTIRTSENSEAGIILNDGTRIDLESESLIVLHFTSDETLIEVLHGSADISNTNVENQKRKVKIKSGGKEVILDKATISVQKDEKQIELTLVDGKVSGNDTSEIKKYILTLALPENSAKIITDKKMAPVSFKWNHSGEGKFIFEIASDRSFKNIKHRMRLNTDGANLELPEGFYYWRVFLEGNNPEDSMIRKIRIIQTRSITILSPSANQIFLYSGNPVRVPFQWTESPFHKSYIFELSKNISFTDVQEYRTDKENLYLVLTEGDYFFRVTATGNLPGSFSRSNVSKISVLREGPRKPVLYSPRYVKISKKRAESGILFRWSHGHDIKQSEILISSTFDFNGDILRNYVPSNYFILKKNLYEGIYYWKVAVYDTASKKSEYSDAAQFEITLDEEKFNENIKQPTEIEDLKSSEQKRKQQLDQNKIESNNIRPKKNSIIIEEINKQEINKQKETKADLIKKETVEEQAPSIISPKNVTIDMSKNSSIKFRWINASNLPCTLIIKDSKGNLLFERKGLLASFELTDLSILDVGKFTWSVSYEKNARASSASFNIILSEQPDVPTDIKQGE